MKEIADIRFNFPLLTPIESGVTFRSNAEVILILTERGYAVASESAMGITLKPQSQVDTVRFVADAGRIETLRDRLTAILEEMRRTDDYFSAKEPAVAPVAGKD